MRIASICSLLIVLGAAALPAQDHALAVKSAATVTTGTTAAAPAAAPKIDPAQREAALAFLKRVEKKNSETKTLSAAFTQTRVDKVFNDDVKSEGQFWYNHAGNFRASYKDANSSELWMTGNKLYNYVPNINQVDVIELEQGSKAPIHQMLLGFGAQVEKILEVFDVQMQPGAKDPTVEFYSKDPTRSMEFTKISIRFDDKKMEPETITAEDDSNTIIVTMKDIKFNPKIDASLFEPKWPEGTEVVNQTENVK